MDVSDGIGEGSHLESLNSSSDLRNDEPIKLDKALKEKFFANAPLVIKDHFAVPKVKE